MISIWYSFLSDLAIASASSTSSGFPASNVQNDQPDTTWMDAGTSETVSLTFNFGQPVSITDFVMTFITGVDQLTSITLSANSINDFSSPPFQQAVTWNASAVSATFSAQKYQYWQIQMTKAVFLRDDLGFQLFDDLGNPIYDDSTAALLSIGRVFLGSQVQVNPPDFQNGLKIIRQDLSAVNTSRGGQDYGILKPSKRYLSLNWTNALDADYRTIDTIYKLGGKVLKFFIQIDSSSSDTDISSIIYVRFFQDPQTLETDALDSSQCWDMEYDLLEQI